MRLSPLLLALAVTVAAPTAALADDPPAAAARPALLEGAWSGTLDVGPIKLRLQVHLTRQADGTYTATFDSLDQGAMGLPFDRVVQTPFGLRLESDKLHVVYEGKFTDDGAALAGEWRQGGKALPLTLRHTDQVPALVRPQEPQPPFPYRAEEVAYTNPADGTRLAGTLTLPAGKGPFPAALLITGSGQQDRDETIFGHKPFKLIADALTRRGVAVLRVDDRGIGGSTGDPRLATSLDFAGDVKAGLAFLRGRADIDPRRLGLVGHSEGGLIAPMVAAADPKLAYIALLAGPGVNGLEIIARQTEDFTRAAGKPPAEVAQAVALERQVLGIAKSELSAPEATQRLLPLLARLGIPEAQRQGQAEALTSPWYRTFLRLEPASYLSRVNCPVLALFGGKDLQVNPTVNAPALQAALQGHRDVTVRVLSGLNHLFQPATTGLVAEYATIEQTMAPEALTALTDWVVAHTR